MINFNESEIVGDDDQKDVSTDGHWSNFGTYIEEPGNGTEEPIKITFTTEADEAADAAEKNPTEAPPTWKPEDLIAHGAAINYYSSRFRHGGGHKTFDGNDVKPYYQRRGNYGRDQNGWGTYPRKGGQSIRILSDGSISGSRDLKRVRPRFNPRLNLPEFKVAAIKMFPDIDSNNNDVISDKEIAQAVENGKFTGTGAQVIAGLYSAREKIARNNFDTPFAWGEAQGITREDISKLGETITADFLETKDLAKDFKKYDTSGNGYLSKAEIAASDLSPAAQLYVNQNFNKIQGANLDGAWSGLSRKDVVNYYATELGRTADSVEFIAQSAIMDTHKVQGKMDRDRIFSDGTFNLNYEDVKQSDAGSCFLMSVLASAAKDSKETLTTLVNDNGDDTYTVTFAGDPDNPVTVPKPTEAELGLFRHSEAPTNGTMWVAVMEKAYGEWRTKHGGWREKFVSRNAKFAFDATDKGGYLGTTTELILGTKPEVMWLFSKNPKQVNEALAETFSSDDPKVVTIASKHEKSGKTESGYPAGHAYSIIDYDPSRDGSASVLIRNPWGGANNTPKGEFWVKVDDLNKDFYQIVHGSPGEITA